MARSRLPQREALAQILNFERDGESYGLEERTASYVRSFEPITPPQTSLSALALGLGNLEDALIGLREAVRWSADAAGFHWWIDRRLEELELEHYILVTTPGSARDFYIERKSSLGDALRTLKLKLDIPDSQADAADAVRLLKVPHDDGASALWHPISLGHEIAHLRFTEGWVEGWMATLDDTTDNAGLKLAFPWAKNPGAATRDSWYVELRRWLMEVACDATLYRYYGLGGKEALASYLSVHSVVTNSDTHPSPILRLATLSGQPDEVSAVGGVNTEDHTGTQLRQLAFNALAPMCFAKVIAELAELPCSDAERLEVTQQASSARSSGEPPCGAEWNPDVVLGSPASIEGGLVTSLWLPEDEFANATGWPSRDEAREATSWAKRVQQSVDFLQFDHRVAKKRHALGLAVTEPRLTNVLHVSATGVHALKGDEGVPSHDVRLGRHFIVFRRNGTPSLNAISASTGSRRIQEMVEVGWGDRFVLHPQEMVLGVTLESIIMENDCTAQVLSRSSLGRMGLLSATAVQVQPGFHGCLTLELVNLASMPLEIMPGQRVAQIVPAPACGKARPYDGKYQDQDWKPRFSEVLSDAELDLIESLKE